MRRGIWLLVLGVLGAGLGVASARASGADTTTGTTTTTTTASTTTTTTYAPLAASSLPAGCVGGGAAAVVAGSQVVALGTPASNLGPSGYPASAPVVAFASSSVSGSTCTTETVTLGSVSLFQGAVTASSVVATDGKGAVAGLEIGGTAVSASVGQTLPVEDWGLLTLGGTLGRLTAPLILRLVQAHGSLSAGTRIAVAFSATGHTVAKPTKRHQPTASRTHAGGNSATTKQTHELQPQKAPPDFPYAAGSAFTKAAQKNPVVSTAMQYLGVPYQWGGANPSTGFDCSGLVQYVFAQLGVSLEHYAAAQYHSAETVWVSPKRLQPGDLVFFIGSDGTPAAPGHVGIYVDDGYFIDAPHSGTSVRVERLAANRYASGYVGARRVVGRLLAARHRMHEPRVSATELILGVPSPFTLEPVSESLGVTAGSAASRPGAGDSLWLGAPLGAALILLSTGVVGVRRRRHTPDEGNPT